MPPKPPSPSVRRFLAGLMRQRGARGVPSIAPAVPRPAPPVAKTSLAARTKVVVIAEDDPQTRQLLVHGLGRRYRIFEAEDGHDALRVLAEIQKPDVIILDVNMPHLDGLGVAMMIKENPALSDVPIIFLTCMDSPLDVIRGIQAGARHYVTKPFALSTLMEKVGRAARRAG
jgi:DNA-binding response OmpR family regulator